MSKRTALVTGGSSGVGLSILPDLVRSGFFVYFVGTNVEKGQRVESELNGAGATVSKFVELDLSNMGRVQSFARGLREEVPALDLLLNVAGAMFPKRQVTAEGFERTFAIGYLSAYVLCRELAPSLAAAAHGRIANVAGVRAMVIKPALDFEDLSFETNYGGMPVAIKTVHAKTVLTEILAERLKEQGIDVNSFHPGAIKGDLARSMSGPMRVLFSVANAFMASTSKSGIYVSTSDDLRGVTGQLFVGRKPTPLQFDEAYKTRLWEKTEEMLAPCLS